MINVNIMLKQENNNVVQWRWRSSWTILTGIDLYGKSRLASNSRGDALASTNHHRRLTDKIQCVLCVDDKIADVINTSHHLHLSSVVVQALHDRLFLQVSPVSGVGIGV